MERYRVQFVDNKAVAASKIDIITKNTLNFDKRGGRGAIESFIIYGDNEDDAIQAANEIVSGTILKFLPGLAT
jgi:hypothetical protein